MKRADAKTCNLSRCFCRALLVLDVFHKSGESPNGPEVSDAARQARVGTQSVNEKKDSKQTESGVAFARLIC